MILSIDCGSTNLKAALYDHGLRSLASASVPLEYGRRDAVHAEFEADRLWASFRRLVHDLLGKAGIPFSDLTHMAIGSQAQTFCLLDGQDRPLIPFLSWMDVRAEEESAELAVALGAGFHRHCSFSAPLSALQAAKMLWVRRHLPEVWKGTRRMVSMPGYLFFRLSGLNVTDANLAAMSGLYSLAGGGWWDAMLAQLDVPEGWLPEMKPSGGAWTADLVLDGARARGVTLVSACNDHTAGAVGNGCRPGEVIVTFGTALVAYARCGEQAGPFHSGGCWGPYPLGGYYELAASNHGCSALDWAREKILPGRSAAEFDALADASEPGSRDVRFVPERARTDSAWDGTGTAADRARAVLEGILFSLRRMLAHDILPPRDRQVCALGGGSKSAIWMRMAADILNCEVRRGAGDSLLGAAALAVGRAESLAAPPGEAWRPDPDRADWYSDYVGRSSVS